jgi:hypothetical protein
LCFNENESGDRSNASEALSKVLRPLSKHFQGGENALGHLAKALRPLSKVLKPLENALHPLENVSHWSTNGGKRHDLP